MARITKTPIQPGTGILALRARHDESTPDLAGVSFSVSPAGLRLVYVDERGGYSPEQGVTSKWGAAFALNVPPGRYHVTASAGGSTWLPATAQVAPDIVTELQMWR